MDDRIQELLERARETAATLNQPLRLPEPTVESESGDIADYLKVDVESDLCLRYAARVIKNVKIGPSPKWMRDRLRVCGVRRPLLPQGRQNAQEHRPAHIEVLKPLIAAAGVEQVNGRGIVIRKHQDAAVPQQSIGHPRSQKGQSDQKAYSDTPPETQSLPLQAPAGCGKAENAAG